VLAASYAQADRKAEAERTVAALRARDPTFDAMSYGTKFQKAGDLEHLRAGLRMAGLISSERPGVRVAR
jgi:hypothetical protein